MTRILCIDLETIPQERYTKPPIYDFIDGGEVELADDYLDGLRDSAGTVDIDALRADITAGNAVLKATGAAPALHPTTAHVVAVNYGWMYVDGGEAKTEVVVTEDFAADDNGVNDFEARERCLLHQMFNRIRGALDKEPRTLIVTFNGKGFDLWVAQVRAALLRMQPPQLPWQRLLYPWDNASWHCDLRIVLGNDKRSRGTQRHWAEAFGIHSEERGAEVFRMVREGRWDDVRSYGHSEGKTLVELFKAVEPVL